jgi:uracil-DNA glycosylase
MDKHSRLLELARNRQRARWPRYKCIGDYEGGRYECDFVSPYTKAAHNLDAQVMVLLQDWSSDERLARPLDVEAARLGYTPSLRTNENLQALLLCYFGLSLADVFATNVFPFVKAGPLNAPIRMRDLVQAAREFAIPQIEIIGARIAVCLGKAAYNAIRLAAGFARVATLDEAIRSPFPLGVTQVWCQAHTGTLGTNNRNKGGVDRVSEDWARMKAAYNN